MTTIDHPLVQPDPPNALQQFQDAMARLEATFAQKCEQAADAHEQQKLGETRCWWKEVD